MKSSPLTLRLWSGATAPAPRRDCCRAVHGRGAEPRTECRDGLFGFIRAQESRVDEYACEPVADRPCDECRRHGRIDAAGERADRGTGAGRALELGNCLFYERRRRPIAFAAAHAIQEVAKHLCTARRVPHLGTELDADPVTAVG